ncbi:sensor histidine kinase [Methanoregula sp.]|uniref:sensor histidine kinase n=1 Tax=Methanoregula sp. TaxID=2052170 RepID=UPI00356B2DEF
MIELPFMTLDIVRSMIQNFAVIAVLVLLYNFIPDSHLSRSKLFSSISIGIIFGLAAAISIPALWQMEGGTVVGFNLILVPLSGFIGGPVSSVFAAAVLLVGTYVSTGSLPGSELLTVMSGILLGALFYEGRSWKRFPRSYLVQYLLLGTGVALIEFFSSLVLFNQQSGPGPQSGSSMLIEMLPFFVASCAITVILGSIIRFIDQKKEAKRELLKYKDQLENLVNERTTELRNANSLQHATIESTADAIVVIDRDDIIRAYNLKAANLFGFPPRLKGEQGQSTIKRTGRLAASLLDPEEFFRLIKPLSESSEQIVTTNLTFTNGSIYELYVHPQRIGDQIVGRVWSFHDITKKREAEETIEGANKKLLLLANITRHDILNQVTALFGHLELLALKNRDPSSSGHLDAMRKSLEVIQEQLEFTRDYQDLGLKKPEWQDAGSAFTRAAESFAGKNIVFSCETGGVEILADPMIGQVFYNLIDNSLQHGERVSDIRLSVKKDDPALLLVYEDNGTGVIPKEKEKIFLKGFGKHTGLGMFLIKEILSITGITIRENGTWQQGARFEIRVPQGKFRFP